MAQYQIINVPKC